MYSYLISEGWRNCSSLWPALQRSRGSKGFSSKLTASAQSIYREVYGSNYLETIYTPKTELGNNSN